jgi:membrane fusion protein, multidrug efflux system
MKQPPGNIIAAVTAVAFVVTGLLVIWRMDSRPRTDDAFLLADIANLAPDVSGRISSLNIHSNQNVHTGDVLFVIDPEPYKLKLDAAKASLELATTTLARSEPLLDKGFVTAEQIDQMRASKDSAQASEALAERDLKNTTVKAPFDGKVIGLTIRSGEYAVAGHPLFTLIDTSRWYVVANFRETELADMKEGTPATIYVMAHPGQHIQGHVDSIGWGVLPDDAKLVNGIPMIPKTLNWVRLAQRFPVRILLDHPPEDLMRIGASAVAVVHE